MRVIAGTARGRRLKVPAVPGLRPTADRARESLFNVLMPGLPGARVLDIFAGSGALGIEALSRGAAHATFVERDRRARQAIVGNLETCGLADRARVVGGDWRRALRRLSCGPRREGRGTAPGRSAGSGRDTAPGMSAGSGPQVAPPGRGAGPRAGAGGELWDLALLDPPWDRSEPLAYLEALAGCISPDGTVVVERRASDGPTPAPGWTLFRTLRAGDIAFDLYRPGDASTAA